VLRPRGELVERTFRTPMRRVLCGNCIPVEHTIFQVRRLSPRAAKAVKAKVAPHALLSGASSVSPVPLVGRFIVEQAQDRRVDHGLLEIRAGSLAYQFFSAVFASLETTVTASRPRQISKEGLAK
jgi:hypothetical protein